MSENAFMFSSQDSRETLSISRETGNVSLEPLAVSANETVMSTQGLIGIIGLNGGDHLIVISSSQRIGSLQGHPIYKISGVKFLPLARFPIPSSDDETYLKVLEDLILSGFYYSYGYDLTRSAQSSQKGALHLVADDRFYWNKRIQSRLVDVPGASSFILPIMSGFVEICPLTVHGHPILYTLISRRSKYRAGVRYHSRGIDSAGNVSNFCETEQIVDLPETGQRMAYLQVRGSIPLYWRQVVNVKYQPALVIDDALNTEMAFERHAKDLMNRYGRVIMINLVNRHGYEASVGNEFLRIVSLFKSEMIKYTHFDFHRECSKMRWDRISLLVDELENDLADQGYFYQNGSIVSTQKSILRTNCMDCLDRTNVVQSVFAKRVLTNQLRELSVLSSKEFVDEVEPLLTLFRNVWANNADAVSVVYSGTGALKTDFTRTGKRSLEGVLADFTNSVLRYVKNNFFDGYRQDAFDLFLGHYEVLSRSKSPFEKPFKPSVSIALLGASLMALILLYFLLVVHTWVWVFILFLIQGLVGSSTILYVFAHGRDFVSKPHLVPINDSIPRKSLHDKFA